MSSQASFNPLFAGLDIALPGLKPSNVLVDRLLSQEPLTPVTPAERKIIVDDLTVSFDDMADTYGKIVAQLREGDLDDNGILPFFDDIGLWTRAKFDLQSGMGMDRGVPMGMWKSSSWLQPPMKSWLDRVMPEKTDSERPCEFLDLGAAECQLAHSVKENYGSGVRVNASCINEHPHYPVDEFHVMVGEYMPKRFGGKLDAVFCNDAMEFAPLPHLLAENVAKSLAPGGEAALVVNLQRPIYLPETEYYRSKNSDTRFWETLDRIGRDMPVDLSMQTAWENPPKYLAQVDRKEMPRFLFMKNRE